MQNDNIILRFSCNNQNSQSPLKSEKPAQIPTKVTRDSGNDITKRIKS